MSPTDPRGARLRAFDAHALAFSVAAAESAQMGAHISRGEVAHLAELAGAIVASLADWRQAMAPLDYARRAAFDEERAGALVLESVFDDLLTPDAWRVLGAAFELALHPVRAAA